MVKITITVDSARIKEQLAKLHSRIKNRQPLTRNIASILHDEIEQNFEEEGRPVKWEQSKRAKKAGGKTLQDSGQLVGSITERSDNDTAIAGTNKAYAAAQNFGIDRDVHVASFIRRMKRRDVYAWDTRKKFSAGIAVVAAHTRRMKLPARPFMVLTDSGVDKIVNAGIKFLNEWVEEY